jgi:hypothetical protein
MNKAKEQLKLERRLDKLWHEAVLARSGGKCVLTGSTEKVNTHHVVTRRNKWGRWFIPNGLTLCPSAHKFSVRCSAHQAPTNLLFQLSIAGLFPNWCDFLDWMERLNTQTDRPKGPIDYEAVEAHLKEEKDAY